jgi:3-isopropylmalate/(R)-2-methylmalate dehydratase small subunit
MRNEREEKLIGKAIKFEDNINTDIIYPSKFLSITDPIEMANHAFKGVSEKFPDRLEKNTFIVAGNNFGCGSSREQAVTCLKFAGVAAVIAKGFSRIYYRNAINQGFPIIQSVEAVDNIKEGDVITVNFDEGKILTKKGVFTFSAFPPFIIEIINAGGLIEYTKAKIRDNR